MLLGKNGSPDIHPILAVECQGALRHHGDDLGFPREK